MSVEMFQDFISAQKASRESNGIKMYKRKGGRQSQMSGPNLHEWQRAKLQGLVGANPQTQSFFAGELKGMPMTAPHTADKDQWLMKGQGSPGDISHSLPQLLSRTCASHELDQKPFSCCFGEFLSLISCLVHPCALCSPSEAGKR